MAGKLGKQPPNPALPKLKLKTLLTPTAVAAIPASRDYVSRVPSWPMYLNNEIGDCAIAAPAHAIEAFTLYGQGRVVELSDAQVLKGYEDVSGYVPGDPNTDVGCVLQDVLSYWRKTGIGSDKIVAFAQVDVKDEQQVAAAIYYFGHLIYGIEVYDAALNQFDAGEVWDVAHTPGRLEGGHAVNVGYYDLNAGEFRCVTWGKVQRVTKAFFDAYADEAWVVVTQDWINTVTQMTPEGLDVVAFGEEFASLTGQANPFPPTPPAPDPGPPPAPNPTPPPPVPPVDDIDKLIAPLLHTIVAEHYVHFNHHQRNTLRAWLEAKGL